MKKRTLRDKIASDAQRQPDKEIHDNKIDKKV